MSPITSRCCQECGESFESRKVEARFCSTACRQAFNNRRLQRGADLYDLFMASRFERDQAAQEELWSKMCAVASGWRQEDERDRRGRKSWGNLREALQRLITYTAHKSWDGTGRGRRAA